MTNETAFIGGTVYPVEPGVPVGEAHSGERRPGGGWAARPRCGRRLRPAPKVVDLGGRLVLPGFQDAHVHPFLAGPP